MKSRTTRPRDMPAWAYRPYLRVRRPLRIGSTALEQRALGERLASLRGISPPMRLKNCSVGAVLPWSLEGKAARDWRRHRRASSAETHSGLSGGEMGKGRG